MNYIFFAFLVISFFLSHAPANQDKIIDLFSQQSPLEMTIVSDFPYRSFQNIQNPDLETKTAGTLSIEKDGQKFSRAIFIRARGSGRLNHCQFAPFKLFFKKNNVIDIFSDLAEKDLKVVTHCYDEVALERADTFLLKEFLMYKILKSMNVPTFEVRMAKIRYVDTHGREVTNRYAFLIEPAKNYVYHNNSLQNEIKEAEFLRPFQELLQSGRMTFEQMQTEQSKKVDTNNYVLNSIGQFVIQNGDWAGALNSPNTKLFLQKNGLLKRVHYDFDLSLLVGKFYSRSNRKGHIYPSNIETDSAWLQSFCKSEGMNLEQIEDEKNYVDPTKKNVACKEELRALLSTRDKVLKTINSFDLLASGQKKDILDRMQSLFLAISGVLPLL